MSFDVAAVAGQVRVLLDRRPAPPVSVVAVDGPGGSGKTTLARLLAEALGDAPIVHTDQFATPTCPLDWWPRVIDEVLSPLGGGHRAVYTPYDWASTSSGAPVVIEPAPIVVLEGVSSSRVAFRPFLALAVWIDTPRAERLTRGLARDGEASRGRWEIDMAHEDDYIARERPDLAADLVVSGAS